MKSTVTCVLSLALVFVAIAAPPTQAQNYRVLYSFAGGTDGSEPRGWLVRDLTGNLFGATSEGGESGPNCPYGCGTIFVITPTGHERVLHRFTDDRGGGYPFAGLTIGSDGKLYGTTSGGTGSSLGGTVFRMNPGTRQMNVMYGFSDGADGGLVLSGGIQGAHGKGTQGRIYGTTWGGGDRTASTCQQNGCGVVFEVDKNGNERVLHRFTGPPDGWGPGAGLTRGPEGNFYGTTAGGGASNCGSGYGCGTIFKIDAKGNETILHSFAGGSDGDNPQAALIRDEEGNLYGTTSNGGTVGFGTVFRLDPSNTLTVLHSFAGTDGANPSAALVRDSAGNLYGTTYDGGDSSCGYLGSGCGVAFRLDPDGNYSLLHTFTGNSEGAFSTGSLLLDAEGNLYGIASDGGYLTRGLYNGVVFEISPE